MQYEMKFLLAKSETGITHDPFAAKVMKCGSIVGHLPKKISSTCSAFLRHKARRL